MLTYLVGYIPYGRKWSWRLRRGWFIDTQGSGHVYLFCVFFIPLLSITPDSLILCLFSIGDEHQSLRRSSVLHYSNTWIVQSFSVLHWTCVVSSYTGVQADDRWTNMYIYSAPTLTRILHIQRACWQRGVGREKCSSVIALCLVLCLLRLDKQWRGIKCGATSQTAKMEGWTAHWTRCGH